MKDRTEKAEKVIQELYGEDFARTLDERLKEIDPDFLRIAKDIAYGEFWSTNDLPLREKSLITIAALVAQGKEEQTKIHMRAFLNTQGTPEEIKAVLLHLAIYCGFPASMNGFKAMREVIES